MDNTQDNIISLLGLEDLPIENRAQLVDELTQILEVRVLSAAYDTLSEEQAQYLDTLLNDNNPEVVTQFIQENVPTLSEIFATQVENLKAELVQHKAEITEKLTQEFEQKFQEAVESKDTEPQDNNPAE
jgi:predicted nucleotide-binding protein (sugar kinase/HSP70/actin superfamily)